MQNIRVRAAILGALTTLTLLAGCAGPEQHAGHDMAPAPQSPHNAADVTFAQGMIPHHQQAIDMAGTAVGRATDPRVRDLAHRIADAQGPEIGTLNGWLQSWGAAQGGHESHSGHTGMGGMMSPQDMGTLEQAQATEFDRRFLELMITHHEGAVTMARTEVATGSSPDAKALAQRIIDTQQSEIGTMRGLLAQP